MKKNVLEDEIEEEVEVEEKETDQEIKVESNDNVKFIECVNKMNNCFKNEINFINSNLQDALTKGWETTNLSKRRDLIFKLYKSYGYYFKDYLKGNVEQENNNNYIADYELKDDDLPF